MMRRDICQYRKAQQSGARRFTSSTPQVPLHLYAHGAHAQRCYHGGVKLAAFDVIFLPLFCCAVECSFRSAALPSSAACAATLSCGIV
ncbi:hypothetical protein KCP76_02825 [Salmonella enterica subsp. enterica serovar Weltevreden]|nr:hypothetical protein KCP76_02825 [Salmonella enterica subsp. enterica serovar Weltevreden]